MSYQYPNQPPQQGYYSGHPPPQNQYDYNRAPPPPPPQNQYGYNRAPHPPPNQQGYGHSGQYQSPPPGGPYGAPPPTHSPYPPTGPGYAPPPGPSQQGGYYPPQGHPPPQQQQQGPYGNNYPPPSHSPQPPFHPQQQGYGAPPAAPPVIPSLGYVPGQVAPGDFRPQADILRKAMKGFGTDEKTLIHTLAKLDPLQMAAVRQTYSSHIRRDLFADVKSETSGYLRQGLLAIIQGPLMHDTTCAREAVQGIGTKEWLLNDILLGRSNADLNAIKTSYEHTYRRTLPKDVEDDLSFKTRNLFTLVLRASRHEESAPVDYRAIQAEAQTIQNATAARIVNNVDDVCSIFARSSDAELRALSQAFSERYHRSLEAHIEKEFSGHMKDALLHMLRTALDPAMRDAVLLEECMKGMGTKDEKLVIRVVRLHWNRQHMDQVKRAYQFKYKQDLVKRVRGETSGDYQRLMVAILE
ncbi:hypothetical protein P175DRAFT_0489677 [Aspergillus ochraceoroseus IBT 24754]|uniref:Annexin n=3 Tax=Aspergillus subgen. Nidulantes TaxID=2720870 RepID=A0A0F8TY30_9EURO|nr:uncharacterized protein P175DRAFT_0489677 [Aspergillus ochraceoroseus IBT 24754]KKK12399.1 hypothetical protein ARAM_002324 [Aspergillus rambellii]KKK19743.1 hypothetical protein AOCH_006132 [Aspergillus ochraceoroseus]PTU24564.1 hypothetical protein P175DRAFT_0489677 [Aspergillus ochraceoroseus IBT 24754]